MPLLTRPRQAMLLTGALAALALAMPLAAQPGRIAVPYANAKYGFSLSLPGDVFAPEPSRAQEAGGLWQSLDGRARLLAVAAPNESRESLLSYRAFVMQQTYKGAVFDYVPVRDTWFVLSGRMDGMMFYERINFACDGRYIYGWQMTYPIAERQRYDRVVEAIHRTYRPGRGEDGRCGAGGRNPA